MYAISEAVCVISDETLMSINITIAWHVYLTDDWLHLSMFISSQLCKWGMWGGSLPPVSLIKTFEGTRCVCSKSLQYILVPSYPALGGVFQTVICGEKSKWRLNPTKMFSKKICEFGHRKVDILWTLPKSTWPATPVCQLGAGISKCFWTICCGEHTRASSLWTRRA